MRRETADREADLERVPEFGEVRQRRRVLDNERRHGCGQHEHGSARRGVREFEQLAFAMVVAAHFGLEDALGGSARGVAAQAGGRGRVGGRGAAGRRVGRGVRGRVGGLGVCGARRGQIGGRGTRKRVGGLGRRGRLSRLNGWVGHGRVGRERGCVGKSEGRVGRGRVVRASGLSGCRSHRRLVGCGAGRQIGRRRGAHGRLRDVVVIVCHDLSIRNGPWRNRHGPVTNKKVSLPTAAASIRSRT